MTLDNPKPNTIEGLQENQIEYKVTGNKKSSVIGDIAIMVFMCLEDTSNESSQQDESLPHNSSTEET